MASGLEDLLGGILSGAQQGGEQGSAGASAGGMDPGAMSESLNRIMIVAGPILALLAQGGGLQDLLGKLAGGGLGDQANSWVGTGENQPVTGEQLAAAMPDQMAELAAQTGVSQKELSADLAQILPGLVNSLSPNGQVPTDPADVEAVLGQIPGGAQLKDLLGPTA